MNHGSPLRSIWKYVPAWAWMVGSAGVMVLILGSRMREGSYGQALAVQLGTAALLIVPIAIVERRIVASLHRQMDDVAAIARTEEFVRIHDLVRHLGQALGRGGARELLITPDHLGRILGAEGWASGRSRDGYGMWHKDTQRIAVPVQTQPLSRGIVFGIMRYAGIADERMVELWNVTRPEGVDAFVPEPRVGERPA